VTFLNDGYNLMHAVGLASASMPARGLRRARTRFLDWLADAARDRADELCVVFDSRSGSSDTVEDHRGVRVRFSGGQTADAVIEASVRAHPRPEQLAVVSNDGQVRDSGRVRSCAVYRCEEFVDWLLAKPSQAAHSRGSPEKEEPAATPDEMAAWLDAFSTPKTRRRR
jgi:predicted RNA-binding protein with PIN domain